MKEGKDVVGTLFQDIARLRVYCYNALLKDSEITSTQSGVLYSLFREEGVNQGELARGLGIRAVTLGGIVDRMVSKGWIERRPDEHDRRVNRIWLTKEGKALEKKIKKSLAEVNKIALDGIDPKLLDGLFDTMDTIRTNLTEFQQRHEET